MFWCALNFASRVFCGFGLLFYTASPACAQPQDIAKQFDVTIVLSEKIGSYAEFGNALDTLLSAKNIRHQVIDSTGSIPYSGLVVGVGMKAATAVAASNAPSVLNVLISKVNQAKLLRAFPKRSDSRSFSAIYLDQPISRQARLIAAILPGKRNVGLLYSTPPKELPLIRRELGKQGLILHEQEVDPARALQDALEEVLANSEVLLSLSEVEAYNDFSLYDIFLLTFRKGVPLIGFSPSYVKSGALCAVYSTPTQIAAQAAALILKFSDSRVLPAAQYPREFEVMLNGPVARSMGLPAKSLSALHDEINAEIEEAP